MLKKHNYKVGQKFNYNKPSRKVIKKFTAKKSPLSVPPVRTNPQPPNATQPTTPSNLQNTAASQTPNQPPQQAIQNSAFSSYVAEPGKPDPRDSQYWQDVTRMYFDRTQRESQANTEQTYAQTAYEQALEARTREHPRDILASNINANQMGNLTSSVQQEDLGKLEQDYYTANTDSERQFQQEQAARSIARDAIAQGYTIDEAAELAAAVDRQSQSELDQPPPPDPNADNYGDTYGNYGDSIDDILASLLGDKKKGPSGSKTTTKKQTKKQTTKKKAGSKYRVTSKFSPPYNPKKVVNKSKKKK